MARTIFIQRSCAQYDRLADRTKRRGLEERGGKCRLGGRRGGRDTEERKEEGRKGGGDKGFR